MERIQLLKNVWQYDPLSPLGKKGGFGQVFSGSGDGFDKVAVKKLHVSAQDAAHRELEIANELLQLSVNHVIPVLDAGQDNNNYYIVMALAEKSLQDAIDEAGPFTDAESVVILNDIAAGLLEVHQFVHRDLKPLNVLRHEGRWKIADFGIARFVEKSTSINTLKTCLTWQYAAPEQLQRLHATSATDIYALGCIAYCLLNGKPPFNGPGEADFMQQHMQKMPPTLNTKNPLLRSLILGMLQKPAEARPTLRRVMDLLNNIAIEIHTPQSHSPGGIGALAQAGSLVKEEVLRQQAANAVADSKKQQREAIKANAVEILHSQIIEPLFKKIEDIADAERIFKYTLQLGTAKLEYRPPLHSKAIIEGALKLCQWDLIAMAQIVVIQNAPKPYEWSASLLYTDKGEGHDYRWYELQFMSSPFLRSNQKYEPFASNDVQLIDTAIRGITGGPQLAARPKPIDDEDLPAFYERWSDLFAKATMGQIVWPNMLPIESVR